ncbi:MAG: hypothetical protein JWR80_7337 [Bradyrhizobium sp.]|nr:hypothetical protein [Bradyrhizobium sp.]
MRERRFDPDVTRPFSGAARWRLAWLTIAVWPFVLVASTSTRAEGLGTAVLINEDPANARGQRHGGSVCWRTDRIQTAGQPDEIAVRADVEIPDLRMKMTMDIRRNTDRSLPASHVVEMTFELPRGVAGGEVSNAPGIMMKFSEPAKGEPLMALSVKITKGRFLVGLSNVPHERARNLRFLEERSWFDIPMVYANQRRGILAIGKGLRGEQIFRAAMIAWEQPGNALPEPDATPCSPSAGLVPAISITDSLLSSIVEGAKVVFEIQDMPEPALRTPVAPMCLVQALAIGLDLAAD